MILQNTVQQKLLPRLSYLILVQPLLVAVDIGQSIADFVPRAEVIIAKCASEAVETLKLVESIHVAFLGLGPGSEKGLHLADAVRARGGRLVFIGDEAEDQGPGRDWAVLDRPFDTDAVLAAINGLPKARGGAASRLIDMTYPSTRHHAAPVTTSACARIARDQSPAGNRFEESCQT